MVETGRYEVVNQALYEEYINVHGDVPDEIHIESVGDDEAEAQELWTDRGEGRSASLSVSALEALEHSEALQKKN